MISNNFIIIVVVVVVAAAVIIILMYDANRMLGRLRLLCTLYAL